MVSLELKGCGVLSEAFINCPLLTSLDASFYSQLTNDCLSATTVSCPLIESLILMSCPSIGSDGLQSLFCLPNLIVLDLSYTFLVNLQPVFDSCLQLKMKASLKGDFYKPTFGGFVDLDLTKDKKISLRSLINHLVVESFGEGGKTIILSRVYPQLAVLKQAHLFVFNNGTEPITMEKLKGWDMKSAQIK
ncbi:hypothetical protein VIGAN_06055200 [Vigna angularis var. angularis]|nr:F-box/LRR-repeat protein 15 [Vigna angularis]XP_052734481.1 F-box/LRR-repeat protein 15 [Vigna angularis]BAT89570.1 hypothetical protein VIGAN_06055200 [Vigna angularis var. angularis]